MRYEILGPLRLVDEGTSSSIGAPKIGIMLAALLIRAGDVVLHDQLMTEIWGDRVPRRASAGLHVYVSQLRKFISRPGQQSSPIVTRPSGYQLRLSDNDEVDLLSFQRLAAEGRVSFREGRYAEASGHLERALALCRGPVLGGVQAGPIIGACAAWLSETRMECVETLAEAHLQMGRHRELIGRLSALTADHPLHEAFYRQLMLALYRSQRQADALRVYESARRTLQDELGLEPCRDLQELQRAILTADAQLDLCAVA